MRPSTSLFIFASLFAALPAQSVVVANRGSGDISVIDVRTHKVETVALPMGTNKPEPMYVSSAAGEVLVGDRANDRVVRFARRDFKVLGSIPVGKGVFHMWASQTHLWVNNDIDNTTSVIELRSKKVIATIPTPMDLVAKGYKPHDVFVTRKFGYVSLIGGTGPGDWVIQFSTKTHQETGRAEVGKDPHLWCDGARLFVPCQGANAVYVLHAWTLRQLQKVDVPGAHGVYLPPGTDRLLVTNISGGGKDGLQELSTRWSARVIGAIDTKYPTPHNITATPRGNSIYVTHSGATADQVTIYGYRGFWWWRKLVALGEVKVGTNPFGLAYVH
ncbi:MAG: YncE family protein [Planctomycetes bacterium]|nr:YncE family protein [Planctomycetota bacterium]MCB9888696.1 YncE family protein [Planctomycetota bacterium]